MMIRTSSSSTAAAEAAAIYIFQNLCSFSTYVSTLWPAIPDICKAKCLSWAALSYSARRYDSAFCCCKMSRDAFLSKALHEADKALEKFAWKVRCSDAGVCVFTRCRMEQTVNRKCMFYFIILRNMSIDSLHLCLSLLCRLLHCCFSANR